MAQVVCTSCGYVGEAKRITKGSIFIEIILWLCFLVPGLIYSIWRLASRYDGCPSCGQATVIPRTSPMAQKFIRENLPEQVAAASTDRPVSRAAHSAGKSAGRLVGKLFK
jgi:hypothetical protein